MDPWNGACNTSYNYPSHFLPSNIPGFMWSQIKTEGPQKNETYPLAVFRETRHPTPSQPVTSKIYSKK